MRNLSRSARSFGMNRVIIVTDFSGTAIVNNIDSRITLRDWLIRAKSESRIQCGIRGRYLNLISESHPAFSFLLKNPTRTSDYIRTFVRYYLNGLCEYFLTAVFCNRSGRRRRLFAIGTERNYLAKMLFHLWRSLSLTVGLLFLLTSRIRQFMIPLIVLLLFYNLYLFLNNYRFSTYFYHSILLIIQSLINVLLRKISIFSRRNPVFLYAGLTSKLIRYCW